MKNSDPSAAAPDQVVESDSVTAALDLDPNIQNVQTLAELHARSENAVGRHQRWIETLTARLGRPVTLYGLLAAVTLWVGYNWLAPELGWPRLDPPPFFWLQGAVGLSALLMTTVVLITQNRQGKMEARRALLDLHVNLLSEQKLAKLIALLEELRRDLPSVGNRHDPEAEVMSRPMDPQAMIDKLEESIENAVTKGGLPGEAALAAGLKERIDEVVRAAEEAGPPDSE